jgi:hypothetical protein
MKIISYVIGVLEAGTFSEEANDSKATVFLNVYELRLKCRL